jgi:hypothetical protein
MQISTKRGAARWERIRRWGARARVGGVVAGLAGLAGRVIVCGRRSM